MYLAIEIGGTKLQLALGRGDGQLAALWRGTVVPQNGADGIRRQIEAALPDLLAQTKITNDDLLAAGVGFGGPVVGRRVIKSHQIAGWDDFPLADWLQQIVGVPVALGNDADVAGLGEALFGAGMSAKGVGHSPLFYVTIGSGIGGGLILDNEIYRGAGRGAAEIGHLRMPTPNGYVPLEDIASGWSIQQTARREMNDPSLTTQDVARLAKSGDATCTRILTTARSALTDALCHVIALLCPKRIVLGGGVSLLDEDLWLAPIRALVAERVFAPFANCTSIVSAALGESAVVHGAIGLAAKLAPADAAGEWAI